MKNIFFTLTLTFDLWPWPWGPKNKISLCFMHVQIIITLSGQEEKQSHFMQFAAFVLWVIPSTDEKFWSPKNFILKKIFFFFISGYFIKNYEKKFFGTLTLTLTFDLDLWPRGPKSKISLCFMCVQIIITLSGQEEM